ncbi:tRNA epoxyqueuosine(34) reductase QueG [Chromatiales bacterium (ex Bugula neritina AB1)]|nr:tRNA epoxyqueuosine(34) reductase QueG [Chromatiales bacterium (ex Bugula neritina AB1)]
MTIDYQQLYQNIKRWSGELGFARTGFSSTELGEHESRFLNWLKSGYHGDMEYMRRNADLRQNPADLHAGTMTIISVRMNYLPADLTDPWSVIEDGNLGYISRYALGRDYHKLMRRRLQKLAVRIEQDIGAFGYRAFVDSAPVLEKAFAEQAGLGWIGKHSNLLSRDAGSWFFLGELYTDLPLPELPPGADQPVENHCGNCTACIDICPTKAIVAPYTVDARRCISYLTIELRTSIPIELRPLIGNRIYGCDDCQLVCPWNKFLQHTMETDFAARHELDCTSLCQLFSWTEQEFLDKTVGSAIRRIGHDCWLRNIAVAMGNAPPSREITEALKQQLESSPDMVREHIEWALVQQSSASTRP